MRVLLFTCLLTLLPCLATARSVPHANPDAIQKYILPFSSRTTHHSDRDVSIPPIGEHTSTVDVGTQDHNILAQQEKVIGLATHTSASSLSSQSSLQHSNPLDLSNDMDGGVALPKQEKFQMCGVPFIFIYPCGFYTEEANRLIQAKIRAASVANGLQAPRVMAAPMAIFNTLAAIPRTLASAISIHKKDVKTLNTTNLTQEEPSTFWTFGSKKKCTPDMFYQFGYSNSAAGLRVPSIFGAPSLFFSFISGVPSTLGASILATIIDNSNVNDSTIKISHIGSISGKEKCTPDMFCQFGYSNAASGLRVPSIFAGQSLLFNFISGLPSVLGASIPAMTIDRSTLGDSITGSSHTGLMIAKKKCTPDIFCQFGYSAGSTLRPPTLFHGPTLLISLISKLPSALASADIAPEITDQIEKAPTSILKRVSCNIPGVQQLHCDAASGIRVPSLISIPTSLSKLGVNVLSKLIADIQDMKLCLMPILSMSTVLFNLLTQLLGASALPSQESPNQGVHGSTVEFQNTGDSFSQVSELAIPADSPFESPNTWADAITKRIPCGPLTIKCSNGASSKFNAIPKALTLPTLLLKSLPGVFAAALPPSDDVGTAKIQPVIENKRAHCESGYNGVVNCYSSSANLLTVPRIFNLPAVLLQVISFNVFVSANKDPGKSNLNVERPPEQNRREIECYNNPNIQCYGGTKSSSSSLRIPRFVDLRSLVLHGISLIPGVTGNSSHNASETTRDARSKDEDHLKCKDRAGIEYIKCYNEAMIRKLENIAADEAETKHLHCVHETGQDYIHCYNEITKVSASSTFKPPYIFRIPLLLAQTIRSLSFAVVAPSPAVWKDDQATVPIGDLDLVPGTCTWNTTAEEIVCFDQVYGHKDHDAVMRPRDDSTLTATTKDGAEPVIVEPRRGPNECINKSDCEKPDPVSAAAPSLRVPRIFSVASMLSRTVFFSLYLTPIYALPVFSAPTTSIAAPDWTPVHKAMSQIRRYIKKWFSSAETNVEDWERMYGSYWPPGAKFGKRGDTGSPHAQVTKSPPSTHIPDGNYIDSAPSTFKNHATQNVNFGEKMRWMGAGMFVVAIAFAIFL